MVSKAGKGKKRGSAKKKNKKKPAARKKDAGSIMNVFAHGISETVKVRGGYELRVYSSPDEAAVVGGMPREDAEALFRLAALAPGACQARQNAQRIACMNINCTGNCHVIRARKVPGGGYEEQDTGSGSAEKEQGWFYFCRCV